MPIPVTCQCGASFSAKDELAGRTVRCPKCQNPLSIPAPQPAGGIGDLLDVEGVGSTTGRSCPECSASVPPHAIICVQCGYNFNLGRRMVTRKGPMSGLDDDEEDYGHFESHGNAMLDKAERDIARDKAEQARLSKGVPWWAYLLGLLFVCAFLFGMTRLPQDKVFLFSGVVVALLGGILGFYAGIRILILAFQESVLWGLLCLFVPFAVFVFIFKNWDRTAGLFGMQIVGGIIQFVGGMIIGFAG